MKRCSTESTLPYIFQKIDRTFWPIPGDRPDPNWALDNTRLDADLKERGISLEDYAHAYTPHSEGHYQQTLNDAQRYADDQRTLAQAGGLGTFASLAVSITDPVQLGIDAALAPIVPELVAIRRAQMLSKIASRAIQGAAAVLINGITSDGEWQKLLQRVREDYQGGHARYWRDRARLRLHGQWRRSARRNGNAR